MNEMFPPNLQKNIRELDRQISLLESECGKMEPDTRDFSIQVKIGSKNAARELPTKPFVTGPLNSFPSRKVNMPPSVSKRGLDPHPDSAPLSKPGGGGKICEGNDEPAESPRRSVLGSQSNKHSDGKESSKDELAEAREPKIDVAFAAGPNETDQMTQTANSTSDNETRTLTDKRSISLIREVSEPSEEENSPVSSGVGDLKEKNLPLDKFKGRTWSDIFTDPDFGEQWNEKRRSKKHQEGTPDEERSAERSGVEAGQLSSGDESTKYTLFVHQEEHNEDKKWMNKYDHSGSSAHEKMCSKKRRPRSVRTRKNYVDDIPVDESMTKAWHEKEIQCMIWNEEREKTEFLNNLNDSIRTLHLLITELKRKSSQEKRTDVLNDMQNTLMKISGIKSMNSLQHPLHAYPLSNAENVKVIEGEENPMIELKKTLYGVKQFCEELSNEKLALSDEVDAKSRMIATMKNKEKEYLSLISNLKFNLEKIKDDADEGGRFKREMILLQNKLQAEAKVTEALKKSHGKMQVLVENYVLENDKLRTQMKLAQLESQKFNVLLAGKEIEIKKYKDEIETFQKQVSEQLKMLRSKASENDSIKATDVVRSKKKTFSPVDSSSSFIKNCYVRDSSPESSKTSLESNITRELCVHEIKASPDTDSRSTESKEVAPESVKVSAVRKSNAELNETDKNPKDGGFASCKSEESDNQSPRRNKFKMEEPTAESKIIKNIDELLEDMRVKSAEKLWETSQNSFNTSLCTMSSSSGEIMSECSQRF